MAEQSTADSRSRSRRSDELSFDHLRVVRADSTTVIELPGNHVDSKRMVDRFERRRLQLGQRPVTARQLFAIRGGRFRGTVCPSDGQLVRSRVQMGQTEVDHPCESVGVVVHVSLMKVSVHHIVARSSARRASSPMLRRSSTGPPSCLHQHESQGRVRARLISGAPEQRGAPSPNDRVEDAVRHRRYGATTTLPTIRGWIRQA